MSRTPRHISHIGVALRMVALLAVVVVSANAVPLESPAVADHPYDYARHPWSIHSSSRNEDYCVDASASSMAEVTARAKVRRTLFEDQPTKDWHQPNDEDRIYFYEHTTPCLDMSSATRDTMELQYRIMDDTGSCMPDSCLYSRTNAWPDQLHSEETQSQFASGDWKNIVIRMKTTHVNGTLYLLHHAVNHETGHFLGLCDPDACGDTGACLVSVMHSYHGCTEREWPQAADRAQVVFEAADGSSGQTPPRAEPHLKRRVSTDGYPPQAADLEGGPLLVKRRDAIKICVQPVGGASVSARNVATAKAIDALPGLTRNSNHPAVYTGFPTEVLQGCPQPPALVLEPGHDTEEVRTPTTDPSDIRVFVYVLPQELLDTLSKDWTDRTAAQEMLCLGYSCDEVTTGLYVGDEEIQRPGFLMKALGNALGLSPWAAPDEVLAELGLAR